MGLKIYLYNLIIILYNLLINYNLLEGYIEAKTNSTDDSILKKDAKDVGNNANNVAKDYISKNDCECSNDEDPESISAKFDGCF